MLIFNTFKSTGRGRVIKLRQFVQLYLHAVRIKKYCKDLVICAHTCSRQCNMYVWCANITLQGGYSYAANEVHIPVLQRLLQYCSLTWLIHFQVDAQNIIPSKQVEGKKKKATKKWSASDLQPRYSSWVGSCGSLLGLPCGTGCANGKASVGELKLQWKQVTMVHSNTHTPN